MVQLYPVCSRSEKSSITSLTFFVFESPPAASRKLLPIKATRSVEPSLSFFNVSHQSEQMRTSTQIRGTQRWEQYQFPGTCWNHQMVEKRERGKQLCCSTWGPGGRSCGSLLDRHPRRICANMSRHSRKCPGPDGMADTTTVQQGSLNVSPISFALCTVPLASLAGHFSLHHFLALETLSYDIRNTDLGQQSIRVKTLRVPNLCKDGDVEHVWSDHARLQRMCQTSQASTGPRKLTSLKALLTLLYTYHPNEIVSFSLSLSLDKLLHYISLRNELLEAMKAISYSLHLDTRPRAFLFLSSLWCFRMQSHLGLLIALSWAVRG